MDFAKPLDLSAHFCFYKVAVGEKSQILLTLAHGGLMQVPHTNISSTLDSVCPSAVPSVVKIEEYICSLKII
ncbi:hypothetical protein Nepgr_010962 [Nepenthes gracilis]|uniref:Uncharacterized protein n=1 Tax=Nepenthes gracilis TaxID=150966 RepID=A0AAD3SEE1_NEPGR|nr:hypothetical protein Nepgr_010962 [Nepenthes gracilis]